MVPNTEALISSVLDEVFSLGGGVQQLKRNEPLQAMLPELDSMAATAMITLLEERLGLTVEAGDFSGADFETVATLVLAVDRLRAQGAG